MEKANWSDSDLSDYDTKNTDKQKIEQEKWVPCRICREIFLRVRLTARYCGTCHRAFCESEHGSFIGRGIGVCVRCYKKAQSESELLQP